jgi:hypothetical protein
MTSAAKVIGVQAPTMDSLISIASILNNVNHWEAWLAAKKLEYLIPIAKIKSYLYVGF